MHPNSIDEKHIETFLMVRKQTRYSSERTFCPHARPTMCRAWVNLLSYNLMISQKVEILLPWREGMKGRGKITRWDSGVCHPPPAHQGRGNIFGFLRIHHNLFVALSFELKQKPSNQYPNPGVTEQVSFPRHLLPILPSPDLPQFTWLTERTTPPSSESRS
jgi:hypothetical protein